MSLPRHLFVLLCSAAFLIMATDSYGENEGPTASKGSVAGAQSVHDDKLNSVNLEESWRGRRRGPNPSTIFNEATSACFETYYKPTSGGANKPNPASAKTGAVSELKKRKSDALEDCLLLAVQKIAMETRRANVLCQCKPVVLDSTNIPGDGVIERK